MGQLVHAQGQLVGALLRHFGEFVGEPGPDQLDGGGHAGHDAGRTDQHPAQRPAAIQFLGHLLGEQLRVAERRSLAVETRQLGFEIQVSHGFPSSRSRSVRYRTAGPSGL